MTVDQAQNSNPNQTLANNSAEICFHSRFFQRLERRYQADLTLLPPGVPQKEQMLECWQALLKKAYEPSQAVRVLRQLVMHRLIRLECELQVNLDIVTKTVTQLAEFTLCRALEQAYLQLDARHGAPIKPDGERSQLWVIGMGKLGARELNVSSDIDLIYVYDQDGETQGLVNGRGRTSFHEFFCKVVKLVYAMIGEVTDHGFVFRVDLALRPNGNSGPACTSLAALEDYFQVQGREWERFAWLKSRIVAPKQERKDGANHPLRSVVLPFVFRRYLDYNVFESLRTLHRQIREQAILKAANQPHRANDVKLGRGGIREIEFTVQLLQVVRGGQFPELRTRPTLQALELVSKAGLMPHETAQLLAKAYIFLRQVEHRIQYLDDQQTQVMPTQEDDLLWVAKTMGFANFADFKLELEKHRDLVAKEFDTLLGQNRQDDNNGAEQISRTKSESGFIPGASFEGRDIDALIVELPEALKERVAAWKDNTKVMTLRDDARARLLRIVQRTGQWVEDGKVSVTAAIRSFDWVETLIRRESYLAMLLERPSVHARVLRLLDAAKWPARYLQKHPGVIDELASQTMLTQRFDKAEFESELQRRANALKTTGEDDEEALLNLLRRALHAEVFRTLARDVEGYITVEQVADDLSALAESILKITTRWCWKYVRNKHHPESDFEPQFGIIAYGKLGGKELGYGSDLDIVFVYEDEHEQAGQSYAALVRKLITWLTVKTSEGDLFEIDTALRPNGNSGLLITTFEAYADYQLQRGSNTAWTWEHQAMTRARFVLGSEALQERFEKVRQQVITAPRDKVLLRQEVSSMRQRVSQAHPIRAGQFDVKHSPGGMVDAEFAIQTMVLSYAAEHPNLIDNVGNIALCQRAEMVGLLSPGVGEAAADAYRELRKIQHKARLDEVPTQVDPLTTEKQSQAIKALWLELMEKPLQ